MKQDQRLIDMTLEDLMRQLREEGFGKQDTQPAPRGPERWLVKGLDGLADLLGCSKTQAWRMKNKGLFDDALYQYGQIMIFDAEMVLRSLKTHRSAR